MLFLPEEAADVVWARLLAQRDEPAGLLAAQLWSHAFFIFPILVCIFVGKRYFAATLIGVSLATSLVYHTCLAYDVCGGVSLPVRRSLDHVTANLNIVAGLSLLTGARDDSAVGNPHQVDFLKVVVPLQVLAVVYAVFVEPYSLYIAYVALMAAIMAMFAYALFFRGAPRLPIGAGAYVIEPLAISTPYLVAALLATAGGIACFLIDVGGESWPHSLWHALISVALGMLALATGLPPDVPTTVIAYRLAAADEARLKRLPPRRPLRATVAV